eukprot:1826264-Pleurochrysis_carterae.AAC.1
MPERACLRRGEKLCCCDGQGSVLHDERAPDGAQQAQHAQLHARQLRGARHVCCARGSLRCLRPQRRQRAATNW